MQSHFLHHLDGPWRFRMRDLLLDKEGELDVEYGFGSRDVLFNI